MSNNKPGPLTQAIHAGDSQNPSSAVSSPIYQAATYRFEEPADIAEAMVSVAHPQFYGRYASPNTRQAEATVAALEGGRIGPGAVLRHGCRFPNLVGPFEGW